MPPKGASIPSTRTLTSSTSSGTTTSTEYSTDEYSSDESFEEGGFLTEYRTYILTVLVVMLLVATALLIYAIVAGFFIYPYSWLSEKGAIGKAPDYWKIFFNNRMYISVKIHPFSIINEDEVLNGAKPKIKEEPVVTFKISSRKRNVTYSKERDDLTFQEDCDSKFLLNISGTHRYSYITPVNVPLWLLIFQAYDYYGKRAPSEFFKLLEDPNGEFGKRMTVARNLSITALIFGGYDYFCREKPVGTTTELCKKIRLLITKSKAENFNFLKEGIIDFSMMSYLFDAYHSKPTMHLGLKDVEMAGHVKKINGKPLITKWDNGSADSMCNLIRGMFHFFPGSGRYTKDFEVWVHGLCRPVMFRYNPKTSNDEYAEFELDEHTFLNTLEGHKCYCRNNPRNMLYYRSCYDGVMSLKDCMGSSLSVSFPHLLYASTFYTDGIEGLEPDKGKHTSRIIMFRKNGSFVKFSLKYQYNVHIFGSETNDIPTFKKVPTALVPIMWVEETLFLTPEQMEAFIKVSPYTHAYNEDMAAINNFRFITLTISLFVIILCIVFITLILLRPKPPADLDNGYEDKYPPK